MFFAEVVVRHSMTINKMTQPFQRRLPVFLDGC
jgi:hypothetical protein